MRVTTSGIPKSQELRFLIVWWSLNHFLVHQSATANVVHLQPTHTLHLQHLRLDSHLLFSRRSAVELFCEGRKRVKVIRCLR